MKDENIMLWFWCVWIFGWVGGIIVGTPHNLFWKITGYVVGIGGYITLSIIYQRKERKENERKN